MSLPDINKPYIKQEKRRKYQFHAWTLTSVGRLIEFEAINEEVLPLLIEQAEESQNENEVIYKVKSFTTGDIIYNVRIVEDKMKACNCPDFTWNNIACEHMYLLKRYNRNIAIFVISTNLPTPEVFIDDTRTEQQQQPIEIELQAFPKLLLTG
ncbi:hypothetical protein BDF21DRAFT_468261 [Thamnidium elegans]|nr:hypothetical protein BDF21DRAFT_468261 [Thamnidium elegans]